MLSAYHRLNVNFIPCDPVGQNFLNKSLGRCARFSPGGSGHGALPHFAPRTVHTGCHVIGTLRHFKQRHNVASTRLTLN